jgi:hypothetical protein
MPSITGRVIAGRYSLAEPIGRGAMGVVWRARDLLLDREVAVKEVVLTAALGDEERANAYQRTLREARTAARLSHRGVVTVYDVAEEDGRPWIVMELVPSRSLDNVLSSDGPLTPLRAARIGQQLLAALAAAHAAGVLHRDVKPSNVLIASEGHPDGSSDPWGERAVLTDFGIAQFEGDPRLTQTGMVMGSPGFTAPERIRGGMATPASDLWSFGATIYAAVAGRGPYEQRGGPITTMTAIINEDAPVAASAGALGPVIAALLRREPAARPTAATAATMFADVMPLLPDRSAGYVRTVRSPSMPASKADAGAVGPDAAASEAAASEAAATDAAATDAAESDEAPAPHKARVPDETPVPVGVADVRAAPRTEADIWSAPPVGPLTNPQPNFPYEALHSVPDEAPYPPVPGATDGGRDRPPAKPGRRRGRRLAIAAAAVVVAAAIGGGSALLLRNSHHTTPQTTPPTAPAGTSGRIGLPPSVQAIDDPSSVLPIDWSTETVTPSVMGTTAGFTIDVPPGWQIERQGRSAFFYAPDGVRYMLIELTPHTYPNDMIKEAHYIETHAIAEGKLPGYERLGIEAVAIRGSAGAFWNFTWVSSRNGTMHVNDQLFVKQTKAGPQSYAIYYTAPDRTWGSALKIFDEMLRTFEPVPA